MMTQSCQSNVCHTALPTVDLSPFFITKYQGQCLPYGGNIPKYQIYATLILDKGVRFTQKDKLP